MNGQADLGGRGARERRDECQDAVVAEFRGGQEQWIRRLGNLRNLVRQEMIRRQLADHVVAGMSALDVGCGQGTQALALVASGCAVTGVEPSPELRQLCSQTMEERGLTLELIDGSINELGDAVNSRSFDLVCAHGLMMYMEDRRRAIADLADRVGEGGLLSVTFRNGHALAVRPALRRDWSGAMAAFDRGDQYTNEIGVSARADRLDAVADDLRSNGFDIIDWYGVRVFNDGVAADFGVPADEDIEQLLDAEDRAGRQDPYRWFGSQIHVIAGRR